jgi:Mor family transcriptional regulator
MKLKTAAAAKRAMRDAAIIRDMRAGKNVRTVAQKYRLTYARITQIVERERGKRN